MPGSWPNCCGRSLLRCCSSRGAWRTDVEGAGAQLSDHQQGSRTGDKSTEGDLDGLWDCLYGEAGLCARGIVRSGSARSQKRACGAGGSSTTSSSMRCGRCARKCDAICWPRLANTARRDCYARFRSSARSERPASDHIGQHPLLARRQAMALGVSRAVGARCPPPRSSPSA